MNNISETAKKIMIVIENSNASDAEIVGILEAIKIQILVENIKEQKVIVDGNARVGEAKVYSSNREMELEKGKRDFGRTRDD